MKYMDVSLAGLGDGWTVVDLTRLADERGCEEIRGRRRHYD